jgi:hypothetical protein
MISVSKRLSAIALGFMIYFSARDACVSGAAGFRQRMKVLGRTTRIHAVH